MGVAAVTDTDTSATDTATQARDTDTSGVTRTAADTADTDTRATSDTPTTGAGTGDTATRDTVTRHRDTVIDNDDVRRDRRHHATTVNAVTAGGVTEGVALLDLTHLPTDTHRTVTGDAAAVLREVWQTFPKTLPDLITPPEEEPDER